MSYGYETQVYYKIINWFRFFQVTTFYSIFTLRIFSVMLIESRLPLIEQSYFQN